MMFLLSKILEYCCTILGALFCLFCILVLMPGDPFYGSAIGQYASDHSLVLQFGTWVQGLFHGDLGWSSVFERPIAHILFPAIKNSLLLVGLGLSITMLVAYFLSVVSFLFERKFLYTLVTHLSFLSISMPTFWLCVLFLGVFIKFQDGIERTWVNSFFAYMIFVLTHLGIYTHHFRTQLETVLQEDFIRTARAKGMGRFGILFSQASLPALFPFIGMMSITLGQALNGQIIIEILFDYPGMGRLMMEAIQNNDIPLAGISIITTIMMALSASFILTLAEFYMLPFHAQIGRNR